MNQDIPRLMTRLESYISTNFPNARVGALRPPATDELVCSVERELGVALPSDIRAMYAFHDGVVLPDGRFPSEDDAPPIVLPYFHWCPIENLLRRWKQFNSMTLDPNSNTGAELAESAVRDYQYHRAWLPVAVSLTSDTAFIDLDPTSRGTPGQLICSDMVEPAKVLCTGFALHIETMLERVERGDISPEVTVWKGA